MSEVMPSEEYRRWAGRAVVVQPRPFRWDGWLPVSELPEAGPDDPRAAEWNCYRREVARLLEEGHEGKWVFIRGDQVVGVYPSYADALEVAIPMSPPSSAFVAEIRTYFPLFRPPWWARQCRS